LVLVHSGSFDQSFAGGEFFVWASGARLQDAVKAAAAIHVATIISLQQVFSIYGSWGQLVGNSHTALSTIFGAFQISYAVAWLLGCMAIDIIGTRLGPVTK
jgi:hypothetical protein